MSENTRTGPEWIESICPVCGRNFLITNVNLWVFRRDLPISRKKYKLKRFTFCSYGCTRKAEKEVDERKMYKAKFENEFVKEKSDVV